MTLIGLGRAWIGCKCIGNYQLYYEEYSNLKIYEISLESIPTIILQIYVAMVDTYVDNDHGDEKSTISLEASITVTILLLSFSIWRVFARNSQNHAFGIAGSGSGIQDNNKNNNTDKDADNVNVDIRYRTSSIATQQPDEEKVQSAIELQLHVNVQSSSQQSNNKINGSQTKSNATDTKEDKLLFYTKFDQTIIFLLIFCDFYIRSFSILFSLFIIRYVLKFYLKIIISFLVIIFLVVVGMLEFKLVLWMKQSKQVDNHNDPGFNFRDEYLKRKFLRFQDTFLLYFSCLIEVVFTFPIKRMHNKNSFNRFVYLSIL